jgi:RNA polymerase sigma-70 factor (ECF subfamily)
MVEMDEAQEFERHRSRLTGIAYRMVGSVSEAEDIVQEAYLRFHRALEQGAEINALGAYLSKVTTRLAIDHLRSARVRREEYVGTWLPEPLLTDPAADAAQHAETADSLSMAFLVLLESLTPVERAVFLLHDVFGYSHEEIASTVGKSVANTRQIAARARRQVDARRPRFEASRAERDELARRFLAAVGEGDMDELLSLLAEDAVALGDGGGKVPAAATPIHGAVRVARFLVGLSQQVERLGLEIRPADVNGQPGGIALDREGRIISVTSLEIADGRIQTIRAVVNPDKLRHLGEVGDVLAMLRGEEPV